MSLSLPRTVKLRVPPMRGTDVDAHGRALHRYLRDGQILRYERQPAIVRRTFGVGKRTLAKKAAIQAGLPAYGIVGPRLYAALRDAGAYDAYADALIAAANESLAPKPPPPPPGPRSLHPSLWPLWRLARELGLSDLGTYNPTSRLPSGAPSDHAVYPALAFDSGFTPASGYQHPQGRRLFDAAAARPDIVEYAIVGDRIWTRQGGLGPYGYGGHEGHVHVSGRRSRVARLLARVAL